MKLKDCFAVLESKGLQRLGTSDLDTFFRAGNVVVVVNQLVNPAHPEIQVNSIHFYGALLGDMEQMREALRACCLSGGMSYETDPVFRLSLSLHPICGLHLLGDAIAAIQSYQALPFNEQQEFKLYTYSTSGSSLVKGVQATMKELR